MSGLRHINLLTLAGLIVASALIFVGCGSPGQADTDVFVSIAPHAFFVKAIGGSQVKAEVLVPPGQSPATFEPTPGQLGRLAGADILFTTGVPFEKRLLSKLSDGFKNLKIVPTHAGIALRPIEGHLDSDHDHGGIGDPHVWLDPFLAKKQAGIITETLAEIDPANAGLYRSNLEILMTRIDSVHAVVANILGPVKGRTMYVFHPAFGYFADAYGLHQVAIERDGKAPTARQLAELIEDAESERVDVVFIQPQFSRTEAEAIGESIGAKMVTLDPLAEDYLNNLIDMATKIVDALSAGTQASQRGE